MRDKYDFLHEDKHQSFLQSDSIVFNGHSQGTQNSKFVLSLHYLKKERRNDIDFLHVDKTKLSYKLIPLILVDMARPAQITQNNKFAKSFQYLKKEVKDAIDFLCS